MGPEDEESPDEDYEAKPGDELDSESEEEEDDGEGALENEGEEEVTKKKKKKQPEESPKEKPAKKKAKEPAEKAAKKKPASKPKRGRDKEDEGDQAEARVVHPLAAHKPRPVPQPGGEAAERVADDDQIRDAGAGEEGAARPVDERGHFGRVAQR